MLYYLTDKVSLPPTQLKRTYIQIQDDQVHQIQHIQFKKNPSAQTVVIQIDDEEQPSKLPINYHQIEQCPTIQLTNSQMQKDPLPFFQQLEKKYEKYGAVKLIASQGWNPPFMFRYVDKGITTRIQVIQQLSEGKVQIYQMQWFQEIHYLNNLNTVESFQQKIEAYSIKGYEAFARNFQSKYKHKLSKSQKPLIANQQEFWGLQSDRKYKDNKIKVEYAADLPVSKYGSGFPIASMSNWKDADFQYESSLWNLNNTYKSEISLLKIIEQKGEKISGVTSPWVYMGMKFASFCWHVQDLYINSLNYNHKGATKTWYVVPKEYKAKFDSYTKTKYNKLFESKPDLLHRITLMIDPLQLIQNGIKVYKINQEQRCYVVTFAKVYHAGFSHGFNVGQAVNYVTPLSFPYIKDALVEYQQFIGKKMAIFPMEWPILENYLNIQKSSSSEDYKNFVRKQYESMIQNEYLQILNILQRQMIIQYAYIPKKNLRYQKNVCKYCKNYCYLSFAKCMQCNKNYCLNHTSDCCNNQFRLMIRQPIESRKKILGLLNKIRFMIQ